MIKRRVKYSDLDLTDLSDSDSCGSDDEAIINKYCPIASKQKTTYTRYVDGLSYSTLLFFLSVILFVSLASYKIIV